MCLKKGPSIKYVCTLDVVSPHVVFTVHIQGYYAGFMWREKIKIHKSFLLGGCVVSISFYTNLADMESFFHMRKRR